MSTESLPRFGSRDGPRVRVENSPDSVKEHQLASPRMPRRYESEEEEVSEADTPSREEHFFSTTDVESDTGGSELDNYNNNTGGPSRARDAGDDYSHKNDDDTFTLRMSTAFFSSDEPSRPTSVYTIKPSRHSSGLSPMPPLHLQQDNRSSSGCGSNTSSSGGSPSRQPSSGSSTSQEIDLTPQSQSFYSDTGSSDEDKTAEALLLTATPVTYYAPDSKPSLVSVSSSTVPTRDHKTTKKQRYQRPDSLSRHSSAGSNRSTTASMKRVPRSRTAKHVDRRSSRLVTEVPVNAHRSTLPAALASPPDHTDIQRRSSSRSSVYSVSDTERSSESGITETARRPLPLKGTASRRGMNSQMSWGSAQSPHPQPGTTDKVSVNRLPPQPSRPRVTGYRTQADNTVPLPNTVGIATSSSKPSNSNGVATNKYPTRQQTPHNTYRPFPPPPVSETPHTVQDADVRADNTKFGTWRDPFGSSHVPLNDNQSSLRNPISRNRSQSISSTVSGSSKFSLPAFDAPSVRSIMRRHRRPHHSDTMASAESTPGHNSPYSERGQRNLVNSNSASKSTTNLSLYSTNIPDLTSGGTRRTDTYRLPREQRRGSENPAGQQHPLRSKGARWFYDTSETVSQAGNKAFTGLGSMLRKTNDFK